MQIKFHCPHCQAKLAADTTPGVEETTCPNCGATITVPALAIGPGMVVGGFRIERRIGQGGMGDVFLAEQLSMNRKVALKILSDAFASNAEVVRRFRHEVRILARLDHPNVVTALEAGEDLGHYYLAMSYVDGEGLDEVISKRDCVPESEVLPIALEISKALAYGWDHFSIIHRDIKPANIMLDREGHVWLMDFGIGKSLAASEQLTLDGKTLGSPHYMSPEQVSSGTPVDFRSDIYSLGVTIYHLVTGETPYGGTTLNEIMVNHIRRPFPSPRARNPNVSEACEHLLAVMMAKRPEQRQQNWKRVRVDIERVLDGEDPITPMPDPPEVPEGQEAVAKIVVDDADVSTRQAAVAFGTSLLRSVRRHPIAVTAVCLAAVALLTVWLMESRRSRPSARLVPPALTPPSRSPDDGQEGQETTSDDAGAAQAVGGQSGEVLKVTVSAPGVEKPKTQVGVPETPKPDPAPTAETELDVALRRLREDNPAVVELSATWELMESGIALDLSGNTQLVDIRGLSGLPLVKLNLSSTGVHQLGPLKGSRLEELDLAGSSVRLLAPLRGMPLRVLHLAATPVSHVGALSGLPLEELTLHDCSHLYSLEALTHHRQLKRLTIPAHCTERSILRTLPSLSCVNTEWDGWQQTAEQFWGRQDTSGTAPQLEHKPKTTQEVVPIARLRELADELAVDLLNDKPSRAWDRLKDARGESTFIPVARQLDAMVLWVASVFRVPEQVRQSFNADIGQEMLVAFRREKRKLRIRSVSVAGVKALAPVQGGRGYIGVDFTVKELSLAEQRKRLKSSSIGHMEVARGLLDVRIERFDSARSNFGQAGELGAALNRCLDRHLASAER